MINMQNVPVYVLRDIREHLGVEPGDDSLDGTIAGMSTLEALNHYLEWNGIVNWSSNILEAVKGLS